MSAALEALQQLISWAKGEHICPRCNGEGELRFNASWPLDPQEDDYTVCPGCGGTGEVPDTDREATP